VTDRGKAVEAGTIYEELEAGAILAFGSVSLPIRRKEKAIKLLHDSVEALNDGPWLTTDSLETARRRLLRSELERSYYADRMADAIGLAHAWRGDASLALEGSEEALRAVDLDDVKQVWDVYVVQGTPVELFIKKGAAQDVD